MAKRKFRLVTLILSGLAALCTLLVMVSCFLPYYQTEKQGSTKPVTVTALQQLTNSYSDEDYIKEVTEAGLNGDEERAVRLFVIHTVNNNEKALLGAAMGFMVAPLLIFGLASFICSVCGMFVSGKMGAMILNILNLLYAVIFFAGSMIIVGQIKGLGLALGAGAIMALVFAVLAFGLSIAAVATRKPRKQATNN